MTGSKALVIEDATDSAMLLVRVLKMLGYDAKSASDGPAALALFAAEAFDLIFCDIGLPGMDGYEVAAALRAMPMFDDARIVAVSGFAPPSDLVAVRKLGFDRFVMKPISIPAIRTVVESLKAETTGTEQRCPAPPDGRKDSIAL